LHADRIAWLTLAADSGMPQPAPVWFLWGEESDDVVIYSQATARRLDWITRRDQASLHLNDDGQGHNYLVMTGTIHRLNPSYPGADEHDAFLSKYRPLMDSVFGDPSKYAALFSVPLVFTPQRARGN
jgi:PPOX class probable F420-dependent enzyme